MAILYNPKRPTYRTVRCDHPGCKHESTFEADGTPYARELAKQEGWTTVADVAGIVCELCPRCMKRLKAGKLKGVKAL